MAVVLAYTSPARGHLYPLTPILDELRARGHAVTLRTLASEVELMRTRGFDAGPIDSAIESMGHDDYLGRTQQTALVRALRTFAQRAEHDGPDLRATIAAVNPDVLLIDINAWGALAVAEASGLPWAAFCPYPLPLPSRDVPPFGPGLAPAHGAAGRLRDMLLRPVLEGGYSRALLPRVNAVRQAAGVPPLRHATDMFAKPPLLLYMTAEPFEYPRTDWPGNIVMIGPCAWEPPSEAPRWLDGIEQPIVLVTTSSEFQDDARLVRCAVEGLASSNVHVVATLPAQDPSIIPTTPNAHVMGFMPHGPMLGRVACVVTHGGMGATQKALAHGVPVCVVPFGRDQLEVARRAEVAAAGTRLPARKLTPERLRAKVLQAMRCTAGARRVQAAFAAAGGATAAAAAIEQRLLDDSGSAEVRAHAAAS